MNKNNDKILKQELIIKEYYQKIKETDKIIKHSKIEIDELKISIDKYKLNLNNAHIELEEKNTQNLKLSQKIDNHTKIEKSLTEKINKNIEKILK